MAENNWPRKLRFMELMQRCLPFKWQRYWNCGIREFDLLMILEDIDNLKLSVQDRLLLTLLARIATGKEDFISEVHQATGALDQEHRQILADWIHENESCDRKSSPASACPCTAVHA